MKIKSLLNYYCILDYEIYIILNFILIPFLSFSQKVYSVEYSNQSDLKVFVVEYENQCDLKVYKVQNF